MSDIYSLEDAYLKIGKKQWPKTTDVWFDQHFLGPEQATFLGYNTYTPSWNYEIPGVHLSGSVLTRNIIKWLPQSSTVTICHVRSPWVADHSRSDLAYPGASTTLTWKGIMVSNNNFGYFQAHKIDWSGGDYNLQRMDYHNDLARPVFRVQLSKRRIWGSGLSSPSNGYFIAGMDPKNTGNSTNQRIGAVVPGGVYSWGHAVARGTTDYDRVSYANDTVSTTVGRPAGFFGTYSPGRDGDFAMWSFGNRNYGYIGGAMGAPDYPSSTVPLTSISLIANANQSRHTSQTLRITYASETWDFVTHGGFSVERTRPFAAGVSNTNYGWIAGGMNMNQYYSGPTSTATEYEPYSYVSRMEISNETVAGTRSYLPVQKQMLSGTNDSNYAFFSGGLGFPAKYDSPPTTIYYSTIDRMSFANDTVNAEFRMNMLHPTFAHVSGGPRYQDFDYSAIPYTGPIANTPIGVPV